MTVKGEPEINVSGTEGKVPFAAAESDNIPVAFASVLDEKPAATANGYAVNAAAYEPTATPTPPQSTVVQSDTVQGSPSTAIVPSTTVVQGTNVPNHKPPTYGARPIPPNAPPGGNWVRYKYTGDKTWGIIAGTGCCLFWCCAMVLAPCALFGLMCPCDEREGYMSPSGVIYDESGRAMGDRRRNKFVVIAKA